MYVPVPWVNNDCPGVRHAVVDDDSPCVRVVEASHVDRLEGFVRPVDVVPHPVNGDPLAVVDACKVGEFILPKMYV